MDQIESNTHSFVVKIWLEEKDERSGQAVWRGRITHVPSGQEHYFDSLGCISNFIIPYLQEMGVTPDGWRRFQHRLHHWFK